MAKRRQRIGWLGRPVLAHLAENGLPRPPTAISTTRRLAAPARIEKGSPAVLGRASIVWRQFASEWMERRPRASRGVIVVTRGWEVARIRGVTRRRALASLGAQGGAPAKTRRQRLAYHLAERPTGGGSS